ncbi:bacteriocin-protection protein [Sphingobacteriales bacterium UPWRP_1]|nr:hypothetical protein B6N25_03525 [Sphingobacteriales bacterium TSM_CSS]PSJ76520.1 bacteriocin-protection protein [Sphingobacteriales bacterium UPWRP_1]
MQILFFLTPEDLEQWFEENHQAAAELWVGYYKKGSGKTAISWQQSVAIAICYGWIDGIRKSLDTESYTNRFTPRRKNSIWSVVNIKTAEEMILQQRMKPAGLAAFEQRKEEKSGIYSFEQQHVALPDEYIAVFNNYPNARNYFFNTETPSYRKTAIHWVMSAKQSATQLKRLQILINCSEQGLKIPLLRRG